MTGKPVLPFVKFLGYLGSKQYLIKLNSKFIAPKFDNIDNYSLWFGLQYYWEGWDSYSDTVSSSGNYIVFDGKAGNFSLKDAHMITVEIGDYDFYNTFASATRAVYIEYVDENEFLTLKNMNRMEFMFPYFLDVIDFSNGNDIVFRGKVSGYSLIIDQTSMAQTLPVKVRSDVFGSGWDVCLKITGSSILRIYDNNGNPFEGLVVLELYSDSDVSVERMDGTLVEGEYINVPAGKVAELLIDVKKGKSIYLKVGSGNNVYLGRVYLFNGNNLMNIGTMFGFNLFTIWDNMVLDEYFGDINNVINVQT